MSLHMSHRRRRTPWSTVIFIIIMLAVASVGTFSCRAQRINDCRDRGGQPLTPALFSEDPADVRCIEP